MQENTTQKNADIHPCLDSAVQEDKSPEAPLYLHEALSLQRA